MSADGGQHYANGNAKFQRFAVWEETEHVDAATKEKTNSFTFVVVMDTYKHRKGVITRA